MGESIVAIGTFIPQICLNSVSVLYFILFNESLTLHMTDNSSVETRVLRLLEKQEDIEYQKRLENRRHASLKSEFSLLSNLLQESLTRVEALDSEIEVHRRKIFEQQRYKNAVETLCQEEIAKGKRLKETIETMVQHQVEQKEVLQEFYEYLLVRKRVPKKDLDKIVLGLVETKKDADVS